jgi:SNF2 family DNA or RNA helicase
MGLRDWFFNLDDRGNGKSVQAAAMLHETNDGPALIVSTKSMLYTWADEVEKWAPGRPVFVLDGNVTKRRKKIEKAKEIQDSVMICTWALVESHTRLAPYGSVLLTDKQKLPKEFNGGWIKTVVADEAHHMKNPKSVRTRALWAVGDEADRRIPMTGTPIESTPLDLWALLRFADPVSFGSKSKFRDRYVLTIQNHWGGVDDLGFQPGTRAEFDRIFASRHVRRPLQVDVMNLPPQTRWVRMLPKQEKAYKAMQKEMLAQVDAGIIVAGTPLVRDTRLHQIAAATPVVDEVGQVTELAEPSCKIDALRELIEEMRGEPLVVFAESRKLIELAHRAITAEKDGILPIERVGIITGQISGVERAAHVNAFQAGEQDLILLTIMAGSEGITLTRSNTLAFLQRSYRENTGNRQAEGRVLRIGQERDVQVIDIVTIDTIEEDLHRVVGRKADLMGDFVNDPDWSRRVLARKPVL